MSIRERLVNNDVVSNVWKDFNGLIQHKHFMLRSKYDFGRGHSSFNIACNNESSLCLSTLINMHYAGYDKIPIFWNGMKIAEKNGHWLSFEAENNPESEKLAWRVVP